MTVAATIEQSEGKTLHAPWERIESLETIAQMMRDKAWLPDEVRPRVLKPLVDVLGSLRNIAMIEPISGELRHELRGYREFCRFRDKLARRRKRTDEPIEARLHAKRRQLRARIQAKRARDEARAKSARRFRLW